MSVRTARLYYENSYLTEFSSVVSDIRVVQGETWVQLEATAFYPTSGGQPYDTGTLTVIDNQRDDAVTAVEVMDGQVWHRTSSEGLEIGQAVHGQIDWARRFDFMQQHSGQHILSACFVDLLGANTVSFHMGDTYSTIDLDVTSLSDEATARVVHEANRWIWRDVPIRARFVAEPELASLKLRKAPSVTEDIRIVTIEGLEDNACGGTHPASTGQVGQILVTKTERMKGGVRVTFACGERAFTSANSAVGVLRSLANGLSVGTAEVPGAVEALKQQLKEAERKYDIIRSRHATLLARDFAENHARRIDGTYVVAATLDDLDDIQDLKRLTTAASEWIEAARPGEPYLVAFIGSWASRAHLVVQAAPDALFGADALVKQVLPALDGKGGGNAKAAQGSAPASVQQVSERIESVLGRS